MRRVIATMLLALCAPVLAEDAEISCTSPATGTLEDLMAQATWTVESGSNWHSNRTAAVRIALPELGRRGFGCLTWSVTVVLPQGVTLASEDAPSAVSNLAAGALATFSVVVERARHNNEVRVERGWFRVQIRNPDADPGVTLARGSGSPVWLYPIAFQLGDT